MSANSLLMPDTPPRGSISAALRGAFLADESECMRELLALAGQTPRANSAIEQRAAQLVDAVRRNRRRLSGLDAFLRKYDLSSQEGVVLMCLAEALLRVPDADTADRLIADKVSSGNWAGHLGTSDSLFVNASTWGLMLTGRLIRPDEEAIRSPAMFITRLAGKAGEPLVRAALKQAMRIMGHQFVMGRTIGQALERSQREENRIFRYSFDMLGEAALTAADAVRFEQAYADAIDAIGAARPAAASLAEAPSISIKLSALHPRYEHAQRGRVLAELPGRLLGLAWRAKAAGIALTVDAEEADRLELSLEVFEQVYGSAELGDWGGFGLAVQAYQKRALAQVRWLIDLAARHGRQIPLRLVKGAYWDTEIKRAQERGLAGYPVFTRKPNTDVSYLACARALFDGGAAVYPQFATHNAHTVAAIIELAGGAKFEFQRLHGMGQELYAEVVGADKFGVACRVYAPVGEHEDLLPYLVRRLLENGANTSFVNRIVDESAPVAEIIADPVARVTGYAQIAHPRIPLPVDLFGGERQNSRGINLADPAELDALDTALAAALRRRYRAGPRIDGRLLDGPASRSINPADTTQQVGEVMLTEADGVDRAIGVAAAAQADWNGVGAAERAAVLERAAELYQQHRAELIALAVREAGKTVPDSVGELREAIDFLRYYAARARCEFAATRDLPGPTGESNQLALVGRGVFVCISPWNFPLAIFTGQVAAALAAGNAVVAKPSEQTTLIADLAVQLLHEAGVPGRVLHSLPGSGRQIGARAVADPRIAGVAFTGSTETALGINRALAARGGPIATLIAETGGQNAMLADSSALPEQVVQDVVQSAFNSAGQRCSALRVLFVQDDIAPRVLELLAGYMEELVIGDPLHLSTDVGPVIDADAQRALEEHAEAVVRFGRLIYRARLPQQCAGGTFVAPLAVEIDRLEQLEREHFGPLLHVIRYSADHLEEVIDAINATGYALTLGVHSRIGSTARHIYRRVRAGNVYVNRNMIGAVVGVQPFGGCGLSGTGPKAGGPYYLSRFATERTLSINTAAVGGNATLLALGGD